MQTILSRTCVAVFVVGALAPVGVLRADYAVLDGLPVTQGQMRIAESDLEKNHRTSSASTRTDRFILKRTDVDVDVSGVLARVRVRQVFVNPYPERLETLYVFPLPENSAVDRYSFEIDERVIRGVVKKREVARQ